MTRTNQTAPIDYIYTAVGLSAISVVVLAGTHCILMDKDVREMKKPIENLSITIGVAGGGVLVGGVGLFIPWLLLSACDETPSLSDKIYIYSLWGGLGALIGGAQVLMYYLYTSCPRFHPQIKMIYLSNPCLLFKAAIYCLITIRIKVIYINHTLTLLKYNLFILKNMYNV